MQTRRSLGWFSWMILLIALAMPGASQAAPADLGNGALIVHHPPGLRYSADDDYCTVYGSYSIDSADEQNPRIELDETEWVWYVLAAWDSSKAWCGVAFGFGAYDPAIYGFMAWDRCPSSTLLELPTPGWPGPGEGTALAGSGTPWVGNFRPVYWFAGYAYATGLIPLAPEPKTGFAGFADSREPAYLYPPHEMGALGIGRDGVKAYPGSSSEVESGPAAHALPVETRLLPATPNPFNREVLIRFEMAEAAEVSVVICDVSGRAVRSFAPERRAAGPHALSWDGRDQGGRSLPAGAYYVRLEVGGTARSVEVISVP
jgi:hypothetical protein